MVATVAVVVWSVLGAIESVVAVVVVAIVVVGEVVRSLGSAVVVLAITVVVVVPRRAVVVVVGRAGAGAGAGAGGGLGLGEEGGLMEVGPGGAEGGGGLDGEGAVLDVAPEEGEASGEGARGAVGVVEAGEAGVAAEGEEAVVGGVEGVVGFRRAGVVVKGVEEGELEAEDEHGREDVGPGEPDGEERREARGVAGRGGVAGESGGEGGDGGGEEGPKERAVEPGAARGRGAVVEDVGDDVERRESRLVRDLAPSERRRESPRDVAAGVGALDGVDHGLADGGARRRERRELPLEVRGVGEPGVSRERAATRVESVRARLLRVVVVVACEVGGRREPDGSAALRPAPAGLVARRPHERLEHLPAIIRVLVAGRLDEVERRVSRPGNGDLQRPAVGRHVPRQRRDQPSPAAVGRRDDRDRRRLRVVVLRARRLGPPVPPPRRLGTRRPRPRGGGGGAAELGRGRLGGAGVPRRRLVPQRLAPGDLSLRDPRANGADRAV
mmetsp:Transcript_17962/g.56320  ORF Transcript_17962/g.56320 Transcript_17962/m.56320 type:complete len:498 (+) Transcript_17962:576-2069(+)